MEGYQNYQQIINALKAEFVKARNLKRDVNVKKRELKTSASFKNRKEAERGTLESKLTTVSSSILTNLQNSLSNISSTEYQPLSSGIKDKLAKLKGQLTFIDSDIARLDEQHNTDPNNIGGMPSPAQSATEAQTLSTLRTMLASAIGEAESLVGQFYNSNDYISVMGAAEPNQMTGAAADVKTRYNTYYTVGAFTSLYDDAKHEFQIFIDDILYTSDAANGLRNQLIDLSSDLVSYKASLANLLDSQAPQSEITYMEEWIANTKTQMLSKATDLKQIEVMLNNGLSAGKSEKVRLLAGELNDLVNRGTNYRTENADALIHDFDNVGLFYSSKAFGFYDPLFATLDNFSDKTIFYSSQGTTISEFDFIKRETTLAKDNWKSADREYAKNLYDMYAVTVSGNALFDNDGQFKKELAAETKDFYKSYSNSLHNAVETYSKTKILYTKNKQNIDLNLSYMSDLFGNHLTLAAAYADAKRDVAIFYSEKRVLSEGHYAGTPEQDSALHDAKAEWFNTIYDYNYLDLVRQRDINKFNAFNALFPDFYSQLDSLSNGLDAATASYESAEIQWNALNADAIAAYDFLNGETIYTPAYDALGGAFGDAFNSFIQNRNLFYTNWDTYSSAVFNRDAAYNLLQTTLTGSAQDYISAKADYDSKAAAAQSFYDNNVIPQETDYNSAYDSLMNLTAGLNDFQAALADWIFKNIEQKNFFDGALQTAKSVKNAAQSLYDAHINATYGTEFEISFSGSGLIAIRNDRDSSNAAFNAVSAEPSIKSATVTAIENQMTFVEATPQEKRDGMKMELGLNKRDKKWRRLASLTEAHGSLMSTVASWIGGLAQQVRQIDAAGFDGLLQGVKDFLENTGGTNQFNTKYMSALASDEERNKWQTRLSSFLHPAVVGSPAAPDGIGINFVEVSTSDANLFSQLSSATSLSNIMATITNVTNDLLRHDAGSSFADRIIAEANNGTPLI